MEWLIAMGVALATYAWGRWAGARAFSRRLIKAIEEGRSPMARALRAVLLDPRISSEIDR